MSDIEFSSEEERKVRHMALTNEPIHHMLNVEGDDHQKGIALIAEATSIPEEKVKAILVETD